MCDVKEMMRLCMSKHYEDATNLHLAMLRAMATESLPTAFEVAVKHLKQRLKLRTSDVDLLRRMVFETERDSHTYMETASDAPTTATVDTRTPSFLPTPTPAPQAGRIDLTNQSSPPLIPRTKRTRVETPTSTAGLAPTHTLTQAHGSTEATGPQQPTAAAGARLTRSTVHPSIRNSCGLGDREIRIKPETRYLIIGDSNLRNLTLDVPDLVQIECFPGAQIHNITGLLLKSMAHRNLKQIYLNVGINDRDNDYQQTTDKKLRNLAATLKQIGIQSSFISIPTDERRALKHCSNVEAINKAAKGLFNEFIRLPVNLVGDDLVHLTTAAYSALGVLLSTRIKATEAGDITRVFTARKRTTTN